MKSSSNKLPNHKRKKAKIRKEQKEERNQPSNRKNFEDLGKKGEKGKLQKGRQTPVSLASRLKRLRGTAASTRLPPEWSKASSSSPKFLTPKDGANYESCVKECYRGFSFENPDDLPQKIHDTFTSSFDRLNDAGLFLYDVVQPGGKKLSLTFVTRTLIGDPGSTYKYLGLRLFSHPWCDVSESGDGHVIGNLNEKMKSAGKTLSKLGYSKSCSRALIQMGLINKELSTRTDEILRNEIAPSVKENLVGSAKYSLTLINRMEPSSVKKDLKKDKIHGIGKTSVSWHKDSGLQDFSSIAVYHTLKNMNGSQIHDAGNNETPWKVALRVADAKVRTPAIAVPLPSGTLYYLLDDFNHQHEHAVISGSDSLRYSSTHRVARDGAGTWQYIRDKCKNILSSDLCSAVLQSNNKEIALKNYRNSSQRKQLVKEVRGCQQLMTELEFEWIRQWYIQGRHHAELHPYWKNPIASMEESYRQLDRVTVYINSILQKSSQSKSDYNVVSEDLFDTIIEAVENRHNLRNAWKQRLRDSIFKTIDEKARPFECCAFVDTDRITPVDIREWRSWFVSGTDGIDGADRKTSGKKRKRKDKNGGMTKKEKRKVANNWQKLKLKL